MKMLGFVTGQYLDPQQNKVLAAIFIPGALSPMTGLLLVVPVEQITDAPLSVEEAMKLIFSGGLVVPSSLAAPAERPDVEEVDKPQAAPAEAEPLLLATLPRAEDFDSGDPDILSDSELEAATLTGRRSTGRRLLGALSWRKK
jgi:hypothetical protein